MSKAKLPDDVTAPTVEDSLQCSLWWNGSEELVLLLREHAKAEGFRLRISRSDAKALAIKIHKFLAATENLKF